MKITLSIRNIAVFIIIANFFTPVFAQTLPGKSEIISSMKLVNNYWININPNPGNNKWPLAAYFTGNMAMYSVYPQKKYLDYAVLWATQNNWAPASRPRHADDHCCGQTYIDLFNITPDTSRVVQIKQRIDDMINTSKIDDWWWVDALYMAMPVFTRLGVLYNDSKYFDRMYEMYHDTKVRRALYDTTEGLWFRDENFSAPEDTTAKGKKIFWSRGNGWVLGAHVRVLQLLPQNDPHRQEYIQTFLEMAAALKKAQLASGFWSVNLADSTNYPGPETSGTAFFTYGLAWGINNGYLDSSVYLPVVSKAWNAMIKTAVHPNGFLGYVQGVGSAPNSSQPVTYEKTADFGIGAFLLAGSEVVKLAEGILPTPEEDPVNNEVNYAVNNLLNFSSQQEDPSNPASNAVDDNLSTRWSASGFPQWIEIDLKENKSINKIEIVPYLNRAYRYYVEAKINYNDEYKTVVDRNTNTFGGSSIIDNIEALNARFIKLTVTGCYDYTGTWVSISEFKVYGESTTSAHFQDNSNIPNDFYLENAYPNPFNSSVNIQYSIPFQGFVTLRIIDMLGREITTLVNGNQPAGKYKTVWSPNNISSSIYLYRLYWNGNVVSKKIIYLK